MKKKGKKDDKGGVESRALPYRGALFLSPWKPVMSGARCAAEKI